MLTKHVPQAMTNIISIFILLLIPRITFLKWLDFDFHSPRNSAVIEFSHDGPPYFQMVAQQSREKTGRKYFMFCGTSTTLDTS